MTDLIQYLISMFSPDNIWALIIAFTFIAYLKVHSEEHKLHYKLHEKDETCVRDLKETVTSRLDKMGSILEDMKHVFDKYVFKFESDEQIEYREKMQRIRVRIHFIASEISMRLKKEVLCIEGKDKEEEHNRIVQFLTDLRQQFRLGLIKDGYGMDVLEALKSTNDVIFPLMFDKLRHIVEIATDKTLNGSKPHAISAMVRELELDMLDKWEKVFVGEIKK
jgi:hypothetical protein